MTPTPRATTSAPHTWLKIALLASLGVVSAACEDKAIGRPCDLAADAGANTATVNNQALECPTRLCLQPAKEAPMQIDTAAFCTAECSDDDDCDSENKRDMNNPLDKRCKGGFTCGIAQVVCPLACKKVCICRDFLDLTRGSVMMRPECSGGAPMCQ